MKMHSFTASIAGGIDAVTDLAFGDGKHVSYMENVDVRSGTAKPFMMPKVNPNVVVPPGSVQVYSYRGRKIYSSARRSYAAEFVDGRERIYWSEYGGNPMKMVEGVTVSLGIPRPTDAPLVTAGYTLSPANVSLTVTKSGGTLTKGSTISFRLAYRTPKGVFPASGDVKVDISTDNSQIDVEWNNAKLDIPVSEIYIFVGSGNQDERFLKSLAPTTTSYNYDGAKAASGENASLYDQEISYQYATAFIRNVEGVKNESGPSVLSSSILSSSSRKITFNPWSEGILDSDNTVTWTDGDQPAFELVPASSLDGYSSLLPLTVESIVSETDTARILCTFASNHYFYDGARVKFEGIDPDPFGGVPVEIQVEDGMGDSCYLIVGYDFVPPGTGLTSATAHRVSDTLISKMWYDPEMGTVAVETASDHTFGSERIIFYGLGDPNWDGREILVHPDIDNVKRFFVDNMSLPIDVTSGLTTVTASTAALAITAIKTASAISTVGATMPGVGDLLYFDMTSTGATGGAIKTALETRAVAYDALMVNSALAGATISGYTYTEGIQFIPHNDYLTHRKLYRTGGTGEARLVEELKLDVLEYIDAIPDASLGGTTTGLYEENGVNVVYEPALEGLRGLTIHYSMGFAWDPASNRLLWTPKGCLDAWPPEFYRDFSHRILRLESYNQALCVFCEDGVYRMDGTDPSSLMRHKTKAAACRAGGSIQIINNRIIYLSDQGLMEFDGQESRCLTDLRIPGEFWLGTSRYLNNSGPGAFLVPFTQNAAFERLRGNDLPAVTPRNIMPYLVQHASQPGIRSFAKDGKYFLYWGSDFPQYEAQTMVCVDFTAPGNPISVIGLKVVDAFSDEVERVHLLLDYPGTVPTWDCPTWLGNPDGTYIYTITVDGGDSFLWSIDDSHGGLITFASENGLDHIDIYYVSPLQDTTFTLSCVVDGYTLSQLITIGYP